MTFEQIQGFVAVAEELHFGRAAERLSMTQPPLSRRIQQLERTLGVALFVRSNRGVALTPAGRVFLSDARRMLQLSDEATFNSRRASGGWVGTVVVGFTAAAAYSCLPDVLDTASRALPDVDIVLREMVTAVQLDALRDGSADLCLVRPPVPAEGFRSIGLVREPMLAAVPADTEVSKRGLSILAFDGTPTVAYDSDGAGYFHDLLTWAFTAAGVHPDVRQSVTQIHTALALVRAGVGWAVVPAAAAALRFEGVQLVPVTGFERFPAEVEVAWRPGRLNPARDSLISALIERRPI